MTQEEITQQANRIFPILHYLHENGEFDNVIKDIKSKLDKMVKDKKKQIKVVKANDTNPCPPGQIWNGTKCVDDLPK